MKKELLKMLYEEAESLTQELRANKKREHSDGAYLNLSKALANLVDSIKTIEESGDTIEGEKVLDYAMIDVNKIKTLEDIINVLNVLVFEEMLVSRNDERTKHLWIDRPLYEINGTIKPI